MSTQQLLWTTAPGDELRVLQYEGVRYQAAVLEPSGGGRSAARARTGDGLPLVFHITGMGYDGGLGDLNLDELRRIAPAPFVLASPLRKKALWWVLDSARDSGWAEGKLVAEEVTALARWMAHLAKAPGIDQDRVSAMAFSAGAYCMTELLCCAEIPRFQNVALGALHGHGQPDLTDLSGALRRKGQQVLNNWSSFLARVEQMAMPVHLVGVHHAKDKLSPWRYAQQIYDAMNRKRAESGQEPLRVFHVTKSGGNRNKSNHNYHDAAFMKRWFLEALLLQTGLHDAFAERVGWGFAEAQLSSEAAHEAPSSSQVDGRGGQKAGKGDWQAGALAAAVGGGREAQGWPDQSWQQRSSWSWWDGDRWGRSARKGRWSWKHQ